MAVHVSPAGKLETGDGPTSGIRIEAEAGETFAIELAAIAIRYALAADVDGGAEITRRQASTARPQVTDWREPSSHDSIDAERAWFVIAYPMLWERFAVANAAARIWLAVDGEFHVHGPGFTSLRTGAGLPDLAALPVGSKRRVRLRGSILYERPESVHWAAASGTAAKVTVEVDQDAEEVILTGVDAGDSVITMTARAPDGRTKDVTFTATAVANLPPLALLPADHTIGLVNNGEAKFPADLLFRDPEGEAVTVTVGTDDAAIATVAVGAGVVTIEGQGVEGDAMITLTGTDPAGGTVDQVLRVEGLAAADVPHQVGSLPAITLRGMGAEVDLDVAQFFAAGAAVVGAGTADAGVAVAERIDDGSVLVRAAGPGRTWSVVEYEGPPNRRWLLFPVIVSTQPLVPRGGQAAALDYGFRPYDWTPAGLVRTFDADALFLNQAGGPLSYAVERVGALAAGAVSVNVARNAVTGQAVVTIGRETLGQFEREVFDLVATDAAGSVASVRFSAGTDPLLG